MRQSIPSLLCPVRLVCFAAVALTGAAGCGGGVQKRVNGATFELSGKEAGLADEYERQEPRRADAKTRCEYWTKRRDDASGNHLVGLFSYPPEYFENLRSWTEANESGACEAAKIDAEATLAKQNEEDRVRALAEAQRDHEARDERAWAQARSGECAAAAREGACDGARAYLEGFPKGQHAVDATAALTAGQPKLDALRHLREEEAARRASAISKQEEAAGFRVSSLRASLEDVPGGSGKRHSLRLTFDLTATRALARGVTAIVRAACSVADKRMVDVDAALDLRLNELAAGDTKSIEARVYVKSALEGVPSHCEVVVMKGVGVETSGSTVHSFCYVPGDGASDGGCPQ